MGIMAWLCTQCGRCCKNWSISVHLEDVERLKACGYDLKHFLNVKNGKLSIKHKNSHCIFLDEGNKCKIQKEHGYEFKPDVCRQFPFDRNGANKFICGQIVQNVYPQDKPFIEQDKMFTYDGKAIPPEVLLYALGKIDSKDYVNSWCSVLNHISKIRNNIVLKSDLDGAIKQKKMSKFCQFRLKNWLASYSSFYLPERLLLSARKMSVSLKFPCEKITLNFRDIENIGVDKSEIKKFIDFLKEGYGIISVSHYPEHLLFYLFFLDDISKQIAHNNKKEKVELIDMINAFSMLNAIIRFPQA